MDNYEPSEPQVELEPIERPTSVTVLGIIGIVLASMVILCMPVSQFITPAEPERVQINESYQVLTMISMFIGIGFAVWLLVTGIGLIKMSRWARRNAIVYACLDILRFVFGMCMFVAALTQGWITLAQTSGPSDPAVMSGIIAVMVLSICGGTVIGLGYPVLLLIFMRTEKVKQAFAQLEARGF